jgi:hypothetical protein
MDFQVDYHHIPVRFLLVPSCIGPDNHNITATVQEACLLSMLRVTAELDDVPTKTIEIVTELGESAGRQIRRVRRCVYSQF